MTFYTLQNSCKYFQRVINVLKLIFFSVYYTNSYDCTYVLYGSSPRATFVRNLKILIYEGSSNTDIGHSNNAQIESNQTCRFEIALSRSKSVTTSNKLAFILPENYDRYSKAQIP